MPLTGDLIELDIIDLSQEGHGIGKADGFAVFVPGTMPGDHIRARIGKVKKNYAFATLESLLAPSPDRVPSFCPVAGECGGCPLAELGLPAQRQLKSKWIRDRLIRIGGIENPVICDFIGGEQPMAYRNKATLAVSTGGNKKVKGGAIVNLGPPVVGYYQTGSRRVVSCSSCRIQPPPALAMAKALEDFMKEDGITAWDENWAQGLLRHLVVRISHETLEVMGMLVINGKGIPGAEKLIAMLDEAVEQTGYSLESLYLNINKEKGAAVFGKETRLLAGKRNIQDRMGGLTYEVSPMSFYQVNPFITPLLYDKVAEYANLTGEERVLDLYCGVGTIGLHCASRARSVLGIESVKDAVLDANRNASINGIVNARFVHGKAEEILPALLNNSAAPDTEEATLAEWAANPDVVILDPPRAGCHPDLLAAVLKASPKRIVYVSCDPATLARDIRVLSEGGYRFVEATPADMFPWTLHVETVASMIREKI